MNTISIFRAKVKRRLHQEVGKGNTLTLISQETPCLHFNSPIKSDEGGGSFFLSEKRIWDQNWKMNGRKIVKLHLFLEAILHVIYSSVCFEKKKGRSTDAHLLRTIGEDVSVSFVEKKATLSTAFWPTYCKCKDLRVYTKRWLCTDLNGLQTIRGLLTEKMITHNVHM